MYKCIAINQNFIQTNTGKMPNTTGTNTLVHLYFKCKLAGYCFKFVMLNVNKVGSYIKLCAV